MGHSRIPSAALQSVVVSRETCVRGWSWNAVIQRWGCRGAVAERGFGMQLPSAVTTTASDGDAVKAVSIRGGVVDESNALVSSPKVTGTDAAPPRRAACLAGGSSRSSTTGRGHPSRSGGVPTIYIWAACNGRVRLRRSHCGGVGTRILGTGSRCGSSAGVGSRVAGPPPWKRDEPTVRRWDIDRASSCDSRYAPLPLVRLPNDSGHLIGG